MKETYTQEMWDEAIENCKIMKQAARLIPFGEFYIRECNHFLSRYSSGERTQELYEAMVRLN